MTQKNYDVLIVGGAIVGSSTAYHLAKLDPKLKIIVVERDLSYAKASTTLAAANIRTVAFSLKENFLICRRTVEMLKTFEDEMVVDGDKPSITFRAEGNLYLTDGSSLEDARQRYQMIKELGSNAVWLEPSAIKKRWSIYNLEGIEGGVYGPTDGHVDGYGLLMAYRRKARSMGVEYLQDEVQRLTDSAGRVTGARLASGMELAANLIVNCAGAWAASVVETVGVRIPVVPIRRQIFAVDTEFKPDTPLPMTVHPSGLYLRSETGNLVLCGIALKEDPEIFDFNWEKERFMEVVWPMLAQFVPVFESLRLLRGWAGLYEVNKLDRNAIIGRWPLIEGLYLCNGFSGHGLMQAPAVGEHMAEIITGTQPTLDLSVLTPQRILDDRPIVETGCF